MQRSIKVNNIKIKYTSLGNGEPIIFLPGFGSNHFAWSKVFPFIPSGYQLIGLEFSLPEKRNIFEVLPNELNAFMRKKKIKRAIIVGHSMGGMVAIKFANRFPGKVKKIILVSTPINEKWIRKTRGILSKLKDSEKTERIVGYFEKHKFLVDFLSRISGTKLKIRPCSDENIEKIVQDFLRVVIDFSRFKWVYCLKRLSCPYIYVFGDKDMIIKQFSKPNKVLEKCHIDPIIISGGHHLPSDNPELIAELITKFLNNSLSFPTSNSQLSTSEVS